MPYFSDTYTSSWSASSTNNMTKHTQEVALDAAQSIGENRPNISNQCASWNCVKTDRRCGLEKTWTDLCRLTGPRPLESTIMASHSSTKRLGNFCWHAIIIVGSSFGRVVLAHRGWQNCQCTQHYEPAQGTACHGTTFYRFWIVSAAFRFAKMIKESPQLHVHLYSLLRFFC